MSVIDTLRALVPGRGQDGPNSYDCPECGRSFEVDAPPERVICSSCGNKDVQLVGGS